MFVNGLKYSVIGVVICLGCSEGILDEDHSMNEFASSGELKCTRIHNLLRNLIE